MAEARDPQAGSRANLTQTLYELSVISVAKRFITLKKCLGYLPDNVLFDVYHQVLVYNYCINYLLTIIFVCFLSLINHSQMHLFEFFIS